MTSLDDDKYQQQRIAAIRAAASVFADKGFHGATTKDIASKLGIKQGSLYYYFDSKVEALHEVCLLGISEYAGRMASIVESNQPFAAKLMASVTSHLSCYRQNNEALKVYNDERLYLPEEKRTTLKELGSGYRQSLEDLMQAAQNDGEVRKNLNCRMAAQSVIGLCNSWGHLIVRDPELDLFDVVQHCTDIVLNGLISD
ncbi:MAG: TetR/AcrR family transcriptional regulator [Gammaproteobacteria bacterium]